ncbi:hypothetical protein ACFWHT_03390 [Microbacterium sp. NPDC058342]|uniref:hypothetical protein n=1 Tax=Microbacterium sp. NPDC058342 TaxID=3346454 RepID=UPI003649560D
MQDENIKAPRQIERRTIVKGAAWAAPVIAAAVAAPARAASGDTELDISVNAECYGLSIAGIGITLPRWEITSTGGQIPVGTTFILESANLAKVQLGGLGTGIAVNVLSPTQARVTIQSPTNSFTASVSGLLGVFIASTFTLRLESLPQGYVDTNPANNADSARLTGVGGVGVVIGRCTEL